MTTATFSSFLQLPAHQRDAIIWREQGKKYSEIAAELNPVVSESTVEHWFSVGGALEQAYLEYVEQMANEQIKQAKLYMKRRTLKAAMTLDELMDSVNHPAQRLGAANSTLARFIPIKVASEGEEDDDTPEPVLEAMDKTVDDNTRPNSQPLEAIRETGDQEVPA